MQLSNDQLTSVANWMKEHGIDEHLIGVFKEDYMFKPVQDEDGQRPRIGIELRTIPQPYLISRTLQHTKS